MPNEYAGRPIHSTMWKTALAFAGKPGQHFGIAVAQDAVSKDDVRAVLVKCRDDVLRWFDVDECRPVL